MIAERYCALDEKRKKIDKEAVLINLSTLFAGRLHAVAVDNGSIKRIEWKTEVPEDIKKQLLSIFSVEYKATEDGYIMKSDKDGIIIYSESERGAFYAVCNIAQRAIRGIGEGLVYHYPSLSFRMIKLYLPSEENIPFFKEFIALCAAYGYNAVMLEVGGAMEYRKHPEINEGWIEYSREASYKINHRDEYPYFPFKDKKASQSFHKNSIHCENGGGGVLSQSTVKELIDYCHSLFMEVIPEVPCFSHSDYLLTRHPELAENKEDLYPDTYCPSNPATYELLFDVLSEIIEVFKPERVNICHDELMATSCQLCEKCRKKKLDQLFYEDLMKIYDFLKSRNVGVMMWSDKLIDCVFKNGKRAGGAGGEIRHWETKKLLKVADPTYPVIDKMPKDIQILHWYWSIHERYDGYFKDRGFWTVFTNFEPLRVKNIVSRLQNGIDGIGLSNWSVVDELHLHRNGMYLELALSAMIMWNNDYDESDVEGNLQKASESLCAYRVGNAPYVARILHTFTKDIPFVRYLDGLEVNRENNVIGFYEVEYADGTVERIPMEYGKTIGFDRINRTYEESSWCASNETDRRILDTGYSCVLFFEGERIFYQFVIPSEKEIKDVRVQVKEEFVPYVEVKEVLWG